MHGLDAEGSELARLCREPVDRELVDARHRCDRAADVLAGDDEERLDEIVRLERRLADEIPQRRGPPESAGPPGTRARAERFERVGMERRHALSPNWSTSA